MPRIEISYRREDAAAITGRIFDRLTAHYGNDASFGRHEPADFDPDALSQTHLRLLLDGLRVRS
jgi:hypothetical protein